jgi:hypothetical protein
MLNISDNEFNQYVLENARQSEFEATGRTTTF